MMDGKETGQAPNPTGEGRSIYIAGPMAGVEDLNSPAFARAAEMLGFTSKNSVKTIEKYVRIGKLTRSSPGRVTLESVENLGKEVAA